ncbi:MAG: SDR family oxidoreductase [Polyangiales bacterium]
MADVALITGASAGLGLEFAKRFAADGRPVALVARRKDRLDALAETLRAAGHTALCYPADLEDSMAPARLLEAVARDGHSVAWLVNNAGFGSNGAFAELDVSRELAMVEVNIRALLHLTRLVLPDMLARGRGRVLNIGSTAGFQPGPYMATYYATKAFVNAFSEALAVEVEGTGVTVTLSCPGATATEFAQTAGNERSKLFQSVRPASAAEVAAEAYAAMNAGRRTVVHGFANAFGVQGLRVMPRSAVLRLAARLNRP